MSDNGADYEYVLGYILCRRFSRIGLLGELHYTFPLLPILIFAELLQTVCCSFLQSPWRWFCIALLHFFRRYNFYIMLFPLFDTFKFSYRNVSHVLWHMLHHSLEHLFHLCFTENCKVHFVFSFQDVINPGNQAFHQCH